jgi:PAS domain S-box-containing protein
MTEHKLCMGTVSARVEEAAVRSSPGNATLVVLDKAAARPAFGPAPDDAACRQALEQMADVCLWVDPRTGHIVDANAALRQALGWPLAELQGRPVQCLAGPDNLALAGPAWQAIADGAALADADITVLTRDGVPRYMSASTWPLRRRSGDGRLALTIWRDVSRRKLDEETLLESRQRLQSLAYEVTVAEARERGRIAAGLHDDIGQILAMAHLKLAELGAAATPQARGHLQEELHGMLVHAMRATRTATFDLRSPLPQQLGLKAALQALGDRARRDSGLDVRIDGDMPALPIAEPVLSIVFRVVRELLLNIQKHAHARNVHITLRSFDHQLMIAVVDDGRGFDTQQRRQFTAEGGFGLVSAEAQMQAIGGRLRMESQPARGTLATVTLPLAHAAAPLDAQVEAAS